MFPCWLFPWMHDPLGHLPHGYELPYRSWTL